MANNANTTSTSTSQLPQTLNLPTKLGNPGDLKDVGQAGATSGPDNLANFSKAGPQAGTAALMNQLQTYMTNHPDWTLIDFANTYAPASDGNNPGQYAANIANALGVSPFTKISTFNNSNSPTSSIFHFVNAVAQKGEGYQGTPITLKSSTTTPPLPGTGSPTPPSGGGIVNDTNIPGGNGPNLNSGTLLERIGQQGVGLLKGAGNIAVNLGKGFLGNVASAIPNSPQKTMLENAVSGPIQTGTDIQNKYLKPTNLLQQEGDVVANVAPFFVPEADGAIASGAIDQAVDAGKFAEQFGPAAGKALTGILKTIGKAITTGVPMAGITAAEGGDKSQVEQAGLLGAGAGVVSKALESIAALTPALKQSLNDNIGKALGATGSKTIQQIIDQPQKAATALKVIADNATGEMVKGVDGVEKAYEPITASFYETLQAFQIAKNKVYNAYTDLANKAGDSVSFTADDFNKVVGDIEDSAKNGTSAFKNKATSLINDLKENYSKDGEFVDTPLKDVQDFVQKINTDVNPASDKAGAQVSGTASQSLREALDQKIENATGKGYQEIRDQYASLKAIQKGLENQTKKAAAKMGGWFGSYVEGFGGLDAFMGLLEGSPAKTVRGLGLAAVGLYQKLTRDPEKALQNAFNIVLNGEKSNVAGNVINAASKPIIPVVKTIQGAENTPPPPNQSDTFDSSLSSLVAGQQNTGSTTPVPGSLSSEIQSPIGQ